MRRKRHPAKQNRFGVQKLLKLTYDGFCVKAGSRVVNNQTVIRTNSKDHYELFNR
jgi:hypothetical protein